MRFLGHIAFAGVSLMALSAPAFAQEVPTDGADSSEDIIVQARRKDESIQDVPLTVNAVSSATIEKLNLRDLKDIAAVVPGLTLNQGNRTTGQTISLRGLAIDNTTSGNNGTVQFYLNDAPISSGAVLQSLYDVGQIEVLRGPQGTLRGIAAPSGSITLTTKRPIMDEFGGYVEGTINTLDGYKVQGAVNLPIVKDLLALRVAAVYDKNENNRVTSVTRPGIEPYSKTKGVRVSLRWTPSPTFEVNTSYSWLERDFRIWDQVESASIAVPGVPVAPATATNRFITARERLAVESTPNIGHQAFDVFNWQAQWSVAGQRLTYVGSYLRQDLRSTEPSDKGDYYGNTFPGDPTASNNNEGYSGLDAGLNLQNIAQASHSYPRFFSHEVRLQSEERLFGMVDYTVGLFMNKQSPWTDLVSVARANFSCVGVGCTPTQADVTPANFTGFTPSPIARRGRSIERAVFGNVTVHLGDSTELSGGIRHLGYEENLNGTNNKFTATIWNASLKHNFGDDLMVYASAGTSFRVGSGTNALIIGRNVNLAGVRDPYLQSLLPITPERSRSYEIGIRSTWLDKKLTLNVSAFHQTFTGYIFPVAPFYILNNPTGAASVPNTNANVVLGISTIAAPVPAKVQGIEAEIAFHPSSNFNLSVTLAYAKATMNNAVLPCLPPGVAPGTVPTAAQINPTANGTTQVYTCTVSQSASKSAPFTASIQGEYNHPLSDSLNGFVRTLVSIYGNSTNDAANPYDDVPAYALVNLYAGVRAEDGAWEVSAYARNLFNTFRVLDRTATLASVATNAGTLNSNYRLISSTEPREFGLTARFAFGSR